MNGHAPNGHATSQSPPIASLEQIEDDIRHNRADMDETLDELGRRLNPGQLAHNAWDFIREKSPSASEAADGARHVGTSVMHSIGRHPLPAMCIGAGLVWLLAEAARGDSIDVNDIRRGARHAGRKARSGAEGAASSAGDAIRSSAEQVTESAGHMAERAGERLSSAGHGAANSVRAMAANAGHKAQNAYESHPIGITLATFAAGLIAGIVTPNTRAEDRAMGATAERMRGRAAEAANRYASRAADEVETAAAE